MGKRSEVVKIAWSVCVKDGVESEGGGKERRHYRVEQGIMAGVL